MTEVIKELVAPLEDRIHEIVKDMPFFTFKNIRPLFPTESDKTIYRAMNKLEATGRIQFLHHQAKQKVYSCAGISKLPILRTRDGKKADLRTFFLNVQNMYDGEAWSTLKLLNEMPIDFCRLFIIADMERGDQKKEWAAFMRRMNQYRELLMLFESYVEAVAKHPAVGKGDLDYFTEIFSGKEGPTAEQKTDFKVWLSRRAQRYGDNSDED